MKRLIPIAALLIACLPISALAQAKQTSAKATKVSFSGTVREDGRAIVAEGRAWIVSNVEKLREHAGEKVSIKGVIDPLSNEIHIISVKLIPPLSTAHLGDSAFRR